MPAKQLGMSLFDSYHVGIMGLKFHAVCGWLGKLEGNDNAGFDGKGIRDCYRTRDLTSDKAGGRPASERSSSWAQERHGVRCHSDLPLGSVSRSVSGGNSEYSVASLGRRSRACTRRRSYHQPLIRV